MQEGKNHWLVRLPLYLDKDDKLVFVKKELVIKRFIKKFLQRLATPLDIFHLRYLDNATKACASCVLELNAKLIFTITPDPHRKMVTEDGRLRSYSLEDTMEMLNKIDIGDELLTLADGIVGIGGAAIKEELEWYFPQLKTAKSKCQFKMIGEGIDLIVEDEDFELWELIDNKSPAAKIASKFREQPVILNVGRLNLQKGQDQLIQAWGESQLWQDYNLLIIGGNNKKSNKEEAEQAAFFKTYLDQRPHLQGRFAHLEELPNKMIRNLEKKLMEEITGAFPNIYLCSSKKEEFGIAILEALAERLLVFAPIAGGVKTYLENGKNGFLIDTSSWQTIAKAVKEVIYQSAMTLEDFRKIQIKGQQTVKNSYSMEEISKKFLAFYLKIKEGKACEG